MNGDNIVIGKTNNGESLTKLVVARGADGFQVETTLSDSIVGVTTGGEGSAAV